MPTHLPSTLCLTTVLAALAVAGCSGSANDGTTTPTTPMPLTLPGVYAGSLPCSNCAAIDATLWLRDDSRFILRQAFTDDTDTTQAHADADADAPMFTLGQWRWDELAAELVLDGPGPDRHLKVHDTEQLRLLAASPIEQLLRRDPAAPPFTDRLALDGESSVSDKGAVFKECLTGLMFPVADAGAYKELRRQHRRLNPRGRVALTHVEGHLTLNPSADGATTSETLVIDHVITLKPGTAC